MIRTTECTFLVCGGYIYNTFSVIALAWSLYRALSIFTTFCVRGGGGFKKSEEQTPIESQVPNLQGTELIFILPFCLKMVPLKNRVRQNILTPHFGSSSKCVSATYNLLRITFFKRQGKKTNYGAVCTDVYAKPCLKCYPSELDDCSTLTNRYFGQGQVRDLQFILLLLFF